MAAPLSSLLERDKALGRLEPALLLSLVFSVLCLESECVLQPNECLYRHPVQRAALAAPVISKHTRGDAGARPQAAASSAIARYCGARLPKMPGQGGHRRENGVFVRL